MASLRRTASGRRRAAVWRVTRVTDNLISFTEYRDENDNYYANPSVIVAFNNANATEELVNKVELLF